MMPNLGVSTAVTVVLLLVAAQVDQGELVKQLALAVVHTMTAL